MTHTEGQLRGNNPADRYTQAVQDARNNANGKRASSVMNEGMLLEALGSKVSFLYFSSCRYVKSSNVSTDVCL